MRGDSMLGVPVSSLERAPSINFRHVDGPLLLWAGNMHWLTWRERIRLLLRQDDAQTIAIRRWPAAADFAHNWPAKPLTSNKEGTHD